MKTSLFKGRSTRTKLFTVITAVGILLLLVLNLFLTNLGLNKMLFIDMTAEGLYTLSDAMVETCDDLLTGLPEGKTLRITFCTDPDILLDTMVSRVVYFMALSLQNRYDNVEVVEHNIKYNPTAVSMYKTTSRSELRASDVIISYGNKYRVINCESFWTKNSETYYSFNGEYKLASAIASLTAITLPKAYFITDLGTSYYDPQNPDSEMSIENATFADLIADLGMDIALLELSAVEKIPEDCAMLILNLPTVDIRAEDESFNTLTHETNIKKLNRFLVDGGGTLVVNKDYNVSLPNLEVFLADWGISFSNSYVVDDENRLDDTGKLIVAEYDSDDQSYGYNFYSDYVGLASAPKMVFSDTGYITCSFGDGYSRREAGYRNVTRQFAPFIGSYATANTGDNILESEAGNKTLAAITARSNLDQYTGENTYSFIFATASKEFYSNEILGNTSYANRDLVYDVFVNISRTDRYVSTDLGGLSKNSSSYGGKRLVSTTMSTEPTTEYVPGATETKSYLGLSAGAATTYFVIVMIPAGAALVLGAVVFIRRKFL